jgi:hemerythrin-like domain-containing protein
MRLTGSAPVRGSLGMMTSVAVAPAAGTTNTGQNMRQCVIMSTPTERHARLVAFGHQLVEAHAWLRADLARLRAELDAYLDGGGDRPADLRAHCLAFCAAVTRHHTGEDDTAFPVLARRFPELRAVVDTLIADHRVVAGLMRRLTELLDGLDPAADAAVVRGELDGLAALLESHLTYEERRIVAALNSLDMPEWADETPAFLRRAAR